MLLSSRRPPLIMDSVLLLTDNLRWIFSGQDQGKFEIKSLVVKHS